MAKIAVLILRQKSLVLKPGMNAVLPLGGNPGSSNRLVGILLQRKKVPRTKVRGVPLEDFFEDLEYGKPAAAFKKQTEKTQRQK